MRELITAQENGQLQTVGVQVAKVIHTCREDQERVLQLLSTRVCYKHTWEFKRTGLYLLPITGFHLARLTIPRPPPGVSPWQDP